MDILKIPLRGVGCDPPIVSKWRTYGTWGSETADFAGLFLPYEGRLAGNARVKSFQLRSPRVRKLTFHARYANALRMSSCVSATKEYFLEELKGVPALIGDWPVSGVQPAHSHA